MKYSSTPRTLNTVLFAILSAGFLFLGIWLGCFVAPAQVIPNPAVTTTMGPALALMLAGIGWTAGLLSVRGLVFSIKSLVRDRDDKPVVESFCSYIAIGFMAFFALLLNGVWQIRLTTTNIGYSDIGFLTAAYIVLAIIVLVVSNVPVLKLFDEGEETGSMMKLFSMSATYIFLGLLLSIGFLTLNTLIGYRDAQHTTLNTRLLVLTLILLIAFLTSLFSLLCAKKACKTGKKSSLVGLLFLVGLALGGAFIIVSGVFENVLEGAKSTTLLVNSFKEENKEWLEYGIRSYIVGSIIVVAAIVVGLIAKFGGKKKRA